MRTLRLLLALGALTTSLGCALQNSVTPLKPSGIIEPTRIVFRDPTLSFEHSWVREGIDLSKYASLYIAPTKGDRVDLKEWLGSSSTLIRSREGYQEALEALESYTTEELKTQFVGRAGETLKLANAPGNNTLVLQFNITDVIFGEPLLHAASTAIPIPAGSQIFGAVRNPSVTFEALLRDGKTGELLASFADKRTAPFRIIDLNKLTLSSANHDIVDSWARELVATLHRKPGEKIARRSRVSLLPF